MSGQAASYYDPNQGFAQGPQQQQPQQQPYYNYNYNNAYDPRNNANYPPVEVKPPQYPPQEQPPPPPPPQLGYYFDDAFKIEKPKFNDLWAGLLVSRFYA